MSDIGIKISQEGQDANTAGVNKLLLDTTYPLLKIKGSGSGTLSVSDGSSDSDTVTHSLGYIPRVFVYGQTYQLNGGTKDSRYAMYPYLETLSQVYYSNFTFRATTTQLIIEGDFVDGTSNSDTFSYFYYIFYDEA